MYRIAVPSHLLTLTAFGVLACGGSDLVLPGAAVMPASITVVQGNGQTGAPGTPLPDSIVVRVTDSAGNPVPNQQVVFTVASAVPGAVVSPRSTMTGVDGTAGALWILGQAAGTQEVVAQVITDGAESGLEVRLSASATAPPPAADRLELRTQPSGTVTAGAEFPQQPVVQIRDAEGKDVRRAGVSVTAAVASGGGTLGGTTTRQSDSNGRVEFTDLRISGASGPHVLIFAAAGYTSVTSTSISVQAAPPPPPSTNQAPIAADDEYTKEEGYEKTLVVGAADGVLRNDRDPEGGTLRARDASDPPNGRVALNPDGSFTYDSDPDYFGDDRFTYRVEDPEGNGSTATVTIHVTPLNDRPRFTHRGDVTVRADAGPQHITDWARNINPGADNESDQILTFDVSNDEPGLFTAGGQPTVTRNGPQSSEGTLAFTPSGRTGTAGVTVVLRDNGGDNRETSEPQTFRITLRP